MKHIIRLFAAAGLFCVGASDSHAQIASPTLYPLTNMPPTLASNVVNCLTNSLGLPTIIPLTKDCDLAIAGRANTSSGGGSEIISGWFSIDGTNFGIAPFQLSIALTTGYPTNGFGFPTNSCSTNFAHSVIAGYTAVEFYNVTNTGPGTASNLQWEVSRPTINTLTY